ncbi:MAG: hypothetical protein [Arlivirus sp. XZN142933]|nr:MAG: hypothetical protein [Arlivirus sp. XZN142933]
MPGPKIDISQTTISGTLLAEAIKLGSTIVKRTDPSPSYKVVNLIGVGDRVIQNVESIKVMNFTTLNDDDAKTQSNATLILTRVAGYKISDFYGKQVMALLISSLRARFNAFHSKNLVDALKLVGFEVEETDNFDEYLEWILDSCSDNEKAEVIHDMHELLKSTDKYPHIPDTCLGVLLCLTGKTLSQNNSTQWNLSRWRSFASKLGAPLDDSVARSGFTPEFSSCLDRVLNQANFLRGTIFNEVLKLSNVQDLRHHLCEIFLVNISWYQMTNFLLITEILIKDHPYFLIWGECARHLNDYVIIARAYQKTGTEFQYLKYRDPNIKGDLFNSIGIQFLASVAQEIGILSGQSNLKNFRTGKELDGNIKLKISKIYKAGGGSVLRWAQIIRNHILPNITENETIRNEMTTNDELTVEEIKGGDLDDNPC